MNQQEETQPRRNPMHEYVDLHQRKNELELEEKEVKARLEVLEAEVLEQFMELGVSQMKIPNGGPTVYLQGETFASLISDKARAHEVMERHDLGYMIKPNVNAQTLRSWVIEQDRNQTEIDQEVLEVLNISKRTRVKVKAS